VERAIGWMDANARGAGMRFDMRRSKPAFAEARICPGGRARNGELQQREEKQRGAQPQRSFPHWRHITTHDSALTACVTAP